MTSLSLRIDKDIQLDNNATPEVFATVYAVDPESGRKKQSFKTRRELVPISTNPVRTKKLDLAEGHYIIEVTLPSGELLSDQVALETNANETVVLKAEQSPHEWLGWQHLVGNVATSAPSMMQGVTGSMGSSTGGSVLPPTAAAAPTRRQPSTPRGTAKRAAKASVRAPTPPVTTMSAPPSTVQWLPTPIPGLAPAAGVDSWKALADIADGDTDLARLLNTGNATRPVPQYTSDPTRAVYRVVHGTKAIGGAVALGSSQRRDYIAIPQENSVELVVLPTPWINIATGKEAVVEVFVQRGVSVSDFATSVSVRDERLGVLLGYLSSGALGAAREIAETARDMLYGKTMNELAAAAGAYAMVGTATDSKVHEWHGWVANLANWFQHMPDGAIQRARLLLQLRRNAQDLDDARKSLKEAYRRGLPYYSLGVRWLLDGLERVASNDPEADGMLRNVRALSWRLHPQSPFTILQLGSV